MEGNCPAFHCLKFASHDLVTESWVGTLEHLPGVGVMHIYNTDQVKTGVNDCMSSHLTYYLLPIVVSSVVNTFNRFLTRACYTRCPSRGLVLTIFTLPVKHIHHLPVTVVYRNSVGVYSASSPGCSHLQSLIVPVCKHGEEGLRDPVPCSDFR